MVIHTYETSASKPMIDDEKFETTSTQEETLNLSSGQQIWATGHECVLLQISITLSCSMCTEHSTLDRSAKELVELVSNIMYSSVSGVPLDMVHGEVVNCI